jgi:hypothetical protein
MHVGTYAGTEVPTMKLWNGFWLPQNVKYISFRITHEQVCM